MSIVSSRPNKKADTTKTGVVCGALWCRALLAVNFRIIRAK